MTSKSCPKCTSLDVVFTGNWSGVMVSDIHAEHFWIGKCNSCGFEFSISDDNVPESVDGKRNHA